MYYNLDLRDLLAAYICFYDTIDVNTMKYEQYDALMKHNYRLKRIAIVDMILYHYEKLNIISDQEAEFICHKILFSPVAFVRTA